MKNNKFTFKPTIEIEQSVIAALFIGAFEGGSNYWVGEVNQVGGEVPSEKGVVWWGSDNIYNRHLKIEIKFDDPQKAEGNGKGKKIISYHDILSGLEKMMKDSPKHFADILAENDDANTADIFLQYVVLGEVVYG